MSSGVSAANLQIINNPSHLLGLETISGESTLGRAPVASLTNGLVVSGTTGPTTTNKAQLDALLNYPENTGGQVVNDTNAANNGIYRKVGASGTGSWTRIADLYAAEAAARQLVARDLGVIPLQSITQTGFNTITGSMLANAGTIGISPTSPNAKWKFSPIAGNSGACTMQIDGGPVSPLVRGDGTPLRRGDLRVGESVIFERRADGSYRIINLTLRPRTNEGGLKMTGAAVLQSHTTPISWDTGRPAFSVTGPGWYAAQPVNGRDALLRCITAGQTIDLANMVVGTSVEVYAVTQTNIFAGDNPNSNTSGASFVGQASSINYGSLSANSSATFRCVGGGRIKVEAVAGTFTYSPMRFLRPAMDVSVLLAGQSHFVIGPTCGAIGGFAREMMSNEMGNTIQEANKPQPDRRNFFFILGATGGTTATYTSGNAEKDNIWWNETANNGGPGPGPMLTNCLNKILAAVALGQPWPTVMFWGQGDGDGLRIQQGTTSPSVFKANTLAIWNYLRNYETSPGSNIRPMANMKVIVFPPGSIDSYFTTTAMVAIRAAFLELVEGNAWAYYGGEMYDLTRNVGQEHLADDGCYAFGQRWALAFQAAVNGRTIDPGPVLESAIYYSARGVLEVKVRGYGADGKSFWPIPFPGVSDDDRNPFGFQFITGAPPSTGVAAGSLTSGPAISTYTPINVLDARCTDNSNSDKRRLTFEFVLDAVPTTNTIVYSVADWSQHMWRRSYPMSLVQHAPAVSVPIPFQRATVQIAA